MRACEEQRDPRFDGKGGVGTHRAHERRQHRAHHITPRMRSFAGMTRATGEEWLQIVIACTSSA